MRFKKIYNRIGGGNKILGISIIKRFSNILILGCNNTIDVRSQLPKNVRIIIYGNNHKLFIDENVIFKSGIIWFEDHDCEIHIGAGTTIEEANLSVAEHGTKLTIGKDCMLSSNIRIATTDSHSIIDRITGERTNPAQDITIGNHVWLGYCVNINKGVTIGDGSIIAGHSVVTKSISSNSVAAGIPAKVVKNETSWNRQRI